MLLLLQEGHNEQVALLPEAVDQLSEFKRAREDLRREKDVEHMIYNMRIQKFMQKTLMKKR